MTAVGDPAPAVSVLLPVFDAAATLEVCLRSVARQTEARFECWIVDDGSTDGSLELAHACARRDARFRVLALEHRGLVATLTSGLARCRAPLVARMDADDVMHRERLALQRAALDGDPTLAAVGSHVRCFPRAGLRAGMRAYERWLNAIDSAERVRLDAFIECPIAHPTLMIRRDVTAHMGYRDAGWPEDYDLVLRLLEADLRIGVVPRRLLGWRQGEKRLSKRDPRYATERFTECRAAFLARSFLAKSDRYLLWGYGGTGRRLRAALAEHDKRPAAIIELHPGRLGQTIHGARVIAPDEIRCPLPHPLVVSVAGDEARKLIRAHLAELGLRDGRDFFCAA